MAKNKVGQVPLLEVGPTMHGALPDVKKLCSMLVEKKGPQKLPFAHGVVDINNCNVYKKTAEEKFPTLKKYAEEAPPCDRYAAHEIKTDYEYKSFEKPNKGVPPEQRIEGCRCGPHVIPISFAEWEAVKFKPEKSVKLLRFTDASNIGNLIPFISMNFLSKKMLGNFSFHLSAASLRYGSQVPYIDQQTAADNFVMPLDLAPTNKEEKLGPEFNTNPVLELPMIDEEIIETVGKTRVRREDTGCHGCNVFLLMKKSSRRLERPGSNEKIQDAMDDLPDVPSRRALLGSSVVKVDNIGNLNPVDNLKLRWLPRIVLTG